MFLNAALSCQENMRKSNYIIANLLQQSCIHVVESWTRVLDLDMFTELVAVKCSHRTTPTAERNETVCCCVTVLLLLSCDMSP